VKENQVRHTDNLRIFTGKYKGMYYIDGRALPKKGLHEGSAIVFQSPKRGAGPAIRNR